MTKSRIVVFAFFLFFFRVGFAVDSPEDCSVISDRDARLDCFDSFFPQQDSGIEATAAAESSPIDVRQQLEQQSQLNRFSITPHRPNYILPLTYNSSSDFTPYGQLGEFFNDTEVKFQLSLKTRLADNLWGDSSLWFGYTQLSFWQLYSEEEASEPFRETNHEPELIWQFPLDFQLFGMDARIASIGLNHQSNGQIDPISRSWNRVTGELVLERGRFVTSIKTWARIDDNDPAMDDNPNIEDYMGRIQFGAAYRGDRHSFAIGLKNNLDSDNRSGVELNWMFPMGDRLRGFVQVYSGYGESMIDMENYVNRVGVGISLNDWL